MADELVFYTNPMSRGRTVRWMLEEVGQPYRTEVLDYGTTMKAPAYLAINPMGKVPAIRHGGVVVTEVAAILAYLADAFPDPRLAPDVRSHDRGPYYRWLFFVAGPFEQAMTNDALGVVVPGERERMVGYGKMSDVITTLRGAVHGRGFVAGDHFTAADLMVASMLGFGMQFGRLERHPEFVSYAEKHLARPAAQRAREMDAVVSPGA